MIESFHEEEGAEIDAVSYFLVMVSHSQRCLGLVLWCWESGGRKSLPIHGQGFQGCSVKINRLGLKRVQSQLNVFVSHDSIGCSKTGVLVEVCFPFPLLLVFGFVVGLRAGLLRQT